MLELTKLQLGSEASSKEGVLSNPQLATQPCDEGQGQQHAALCC